MFLKFMETQVEINGRQTGMNDVFIEQIGFLLEVCEEHEKTIKELREELNKLKASKMD